MQSCGLFQQYTYSQEDIGGKFTPVCGLPLVTEDTNACGSSPLKVTQTGKADGQHAFCNIVTGAGC